MVTSVPPPPVGAGLVLPGEANSLSRIAAPQLAAQGKPLDPVSRVWLQGNWYVGTNNFAKFGVMPSPRQEAQFGWITFSQDPQNRERKRARVWLAQPSTVG